MTYKVIATHNQCHLDEMAGIWLLRRFGDISFAGISEARVEFWGQMPEGKTPKEFESEGILLIGIGGGRFDEHPCADGGRKKDECAITLIAKELGLDEDPALRSLIEFVCKRDLTLTGSPFDLHAMIKTFYSAGRDDMTVWEWVFAALEAIYEQSLKFFEGAATDFQSAEIRDVQIGGRKTKLAIGVSDSREFAKFARSAHGCRAGIVIQRNSAGNVHVQTRNNLGINLLDTAQMIRIEEILAQGKVVSNDWEYLRREGTLPECPAWHFSSEGKMLLNGSTTHVKEPTRLPLDRIAELVQIGINPQAFEKNRAAQCQQGNCTSTSKNPCPWYGWGLHRCRRIRFAQRQSNGGGK